MVEGFAGGFGAYVVMDVGFAELGEGDEVGDGFAAGLDAKLLLRIPNRKLLPIHTTHRNAKLLPIHLRQLRYITRHTPSLIPPHLLINLLNMLRKSCKI